MDVAPCATEYWPTRLSLSLSLSLHAAQSLQCSPDRIIQEDRKQPGNNNFNEIRSAVELGTTIEYGQSPGFPITTVDNIIAQGSRRLLLTLDPRFRWNNRSLLI